MKKILAAVIISIAIATPVLAEVSFNFSLPIDILMNPKTITPERAVRTIIDGVQINNQGEKINTDYFNGNVYIQNQNGSGIGLQNDRVEFNYRGY